MTDLWHDTADAKIHREMRGVSDDGSGCAVVWSAPVVPDSVEDLLCRWRSITMANYHACRRRNLTLDMYHPFASRLAVEIDRLQVTGPIVAAWGPEWYAAAEDYDQFRGDKLAKFATRLAEWISDGCPMEE